ncbi:hypothetical protein ACFFX0_15705 [Citricoccus parietis]|uniref:Uncharacterized protein n=1 Tax=Citricoccus parietis TaxID=592307 RepID=A0ABV5G0V8_9MICC
MDLPSASLISGSTTRVCTCTEVRPVCTTRDCTTTRVSTGTGLPKCMLPT